MMATDIQHWQNKYTSANAEVTALFQQLQQVVALSAAFNPAILDAVGKTAGSSQVTSSAAQNTAFNVLGCLIHSDGPAFTPANQWLAGCIEVS